MKSKGYKDSGILALAAFYSIAMIFILIFTVMVMSKKQAETSSVTKYIIETEYVYITEDIPETSINDSVATEVAESVFETLIIKEYGERIGIFNLDGELVYHLDVYTKTLPEADRRLLEEGFEIVDENQLAAIIQDYSS